MPKMTLTDAAIKRLKTPPSGRVDYFDKTVPGFACRVSASGRKVYTMVYRLDGRQIKRTIGHVEGIDLSDARDEARKYFNAAKQAADARKAIRSEGITDAERHEAQRKLDAARVRLEDGEPANIPTYAEAVNQFIEKHAQGKKDNRTWAEQKRILTHYSPSWLARSVDEITRKDILDVLDGMVSRKVGYMANRTYAAYRTFFKWCHGRDLIRSNPMEKVERPFDGEKGKDRFYDDDELKALWKAAETIGGSQGALLKVLMLQGQRIGEIAGMRWDELDLDEGTWTLPGERTKNKRDHVFPLAPVTVTIIRAQRRVKDSPYVFPGRNHGKPIGGYSPLQRKVAKLTSIADYTNHAFCHTLVTGLQKLNVPPHVITACRHHTPQGVTEKHYSHYDYLDEQREAFDAWASYVTALVTPEGVEALHG